MIIHKLNLRPEIKAELFSRARKFSAAAEAAMPELSDAHYWAVGKFPGTCIRQFSHEVTGSELGPTAMACEALPVAASYDALLEKDPELALLFSRFGLHPYHGISNNDAQWGYHRHVYDPAMMYTLTLIESLSGPAILRFWGMPDHDDPPRDGFLLDVLPADHARKMPLHDEPLMAGEAYLVSSWVWHSVVNGGSRIVARLLIPDQCSTQSKAFKFIETLENM